MPVRRPVTRTKQHQGEGDEGDSADDANEQAIPNATCFGFHSRHRRSMTIGAVDMLFICLEHCNLDK